MLEQCHPNLPFGALTYLAQACLSPSPAPSMPSAFLCGLPPPWGGGFTERKPVGDRTKQGQAHSAAPLH